MDKIGEIQDIVIDDLFKDDDAGTPPVTDEQKLDLTKAMSKRINEVRAKTEIEVRDKIAKDLGYDTYEELEKAKTKKEITEAGYDAETIEKIIEPLLEKRLASDPRIQKYEQQEKEQYVQSELAEIEKLTGIKVTRADLTPEVLALHEKGIKLSQAYFAANSTKLISAGTKGTTDHLAGISGSGQVKTRALTAQEKDLYRAIHPGITDEQLSKKTVEIKK